MSGLYEVRGRVHVFRMIHATHADEAESLTIAVLEDPRLLGDLFDTAGVEVEDFEITETVRVE